MNNSADSSSAASGSGDGGSGGADSSAGSYGIVNGGAAATLGEKLEGGRQAVRQAAAATTSWFANRAGTQTVARPLPETGAPPETRPQPRTETMAQPETRPQPQAAYQPPPQPQSSQPPPQPQPSQPPSAARGPGYAPGYGGVPAPAWQTRAAGPERKPDPGRRSRRQAHLTLARVEPWSVMKFSFVASIVAFIILFVAITVLYMTLSGLGVFTSLQHTVSTITSSQSTTGTDISGWFSAQTILGWTGFLGALNIVLITALATIGAVVYNLIAHVFGGVEVTLRESDLAAAGVRPGASGRRDAVKYRSRR